MDPITLLALISGSAKLIEQIAPIISRIHAGGTITAEEQSEIRAAYENLQKSGDAAFAGPEWQVEPK